MSQLHQQPHQQPDQQPDQRIHHQLHHHSHLEEQDRARLFAVPPQGFDRDSPARRLALALGATLYTPATRPRLAAEAARAARIGTTSLVWCLEDAIPHEAVPAAEQAVGRALAEVARAGRAVPLLFVRARTPEQVLRVTALAGAGATVLSGFVLPKITAATGEAFLAAVEEAAGLAGRRLHAMPVLETPELAWRESRAAELASLRALVDAHRETVLAVRVGATDLSGLWGLRRDRDTTVWDVAVVRDVIADIVNVFGRRAEHLVTGPAWEHVGGARMLKPRLRRTPFEQADEARLRSALVDDDVDELMREVALDGANGLTGKTVIHPTHVSVVNALLTVTREEYDDALTVLAGRDDGGVLPSSGGAAMLELGPHARWAEQVSERAAVYGVLAHGEALVELLAAGRAAALAAYRRPVGATP